MGTRNLIFNRTFTVIKHEPLDAKWLHRWTLGWDIWRTSPQMSKDPEK